MGAVPLSSFQSRAPRLLASHRDPESYVAGASPLVISEAPIDAAVTARVLRVASDEADEFVRAMPAGKEGLLFLRDGLPMQPDPGTHLPRSEVERLLRNLPDAA